MLSASQLLAIVAVLMCQTVVADKYEKMFVAGNHEDEVKSAVCADITDAAKKIEAEGDVLLKETFIGNKNLVSNYRLAHFKASMSVLRHTACDEARKLAVKTGDQIDAKAAHANFARIVKESGDKFNAALKDFKESHEQTPKNESDDPCFELNEDIKSVRERANFNAVHETNIIREAFHRIFYGQTEQISKQYASSIEGIASVPKDLQTAVEKLAHKLKDEAAKAVDFMVPQTWVQGQLAMKKESRDERTFLYECSSSWKTRKLHFQDTLQEHQSGIRQIFTYHKYYVHIMAARTRNVFEMSPQLLFELSTAEFLSQFIDHPQKFAEEKIKAAVEYLSSSKLAKENRAPVLSSFNKMLDDFGREAYAELRKNDFKVESSKIGMYLQANGFDELEKRVPIVERLRQDAEKLANAWMS